MVCAPENGLIFPDEVPTDHGSGEQQEQKYHLGRVGADEGEEEDAGKDRRCDQNASPNVKNTPLWSLEPP